MLRETRDGASSRQPEDHRPEGNMLLLHRIRLWKGKADNACQWHGCTLTADKGSKSLLTAAVQETEVGLAAK